MRIGLWSIGALCLLVGLSLWLVTRSWFMIWQLGPQLERRLGGDVEIGSAVYERGGTLVFRDVTLRSRAHPGPAGEVLRVGRLEVRVDLHELISGNLRLERIQLEQVIIRASEDANEPGVFSFMALEPDWSRHEDIDQLVLPPQVQIRDAVLELGVHDGARYEMRGRQRVSGQMSPLYENDPWYNLVLSEIDEHGNRRGADGLLISGRWNVATNQYTLRVDGLALDDKTYQMCPQLALLWWDRMDLEGRVSSASLEWEPGKPYSVEFALENVGLTLPIETEGLWAQYRFGQIVPASGRPRMLVKSGTIRLEGDRLTLDSLTGDLVSADASWGLGAEPDTTDLVGVPYQVDVSILSLPEMDWDNKQQWMDEILATAPFKMRVRMDEFGLGTQPAAESPAVELPLLVARVLERFKMTGWLLTTHVEVSRDAPLEDDEGNLIPQPIRWSGQALIRKATGQAEQFAYPLENVEAYLQFDNDKLIVHRLEGRGPTGAVVRVSGEIAPPGDDPGVSLHLIVEDAPLDETLRGALKGGALAAFDALLHRPSFESLKAAGLLTDDTLVSGQPFRLGGTVDLDLRIQRPAGPDQETTITGSVNIDSVGLLYENLPYPLLITGGRLDWQADKIVIEPGEAGRGLPLITPGGGRGWVSGEVGLPSVGDRREVRPRLTISVENDQVNDFVFAAIPLTEDERAQLPQEQQRPGVTLSRRARLLKGIRLSGSLNYGGTIEAEDDGELRGHFSVQLVDGRAQPTEQAIEEMGGDGLLWPIGLALDEVQARIEVSPDDIRIAEFSGRFAEGWVTADGVIELKSDPIDATINVHFDDVALGPILEHLPAGKGGAWDLWERFRPQGKIDAELHYHARGTEVDPMVLHVRPQEIQLRIDDQLVVLTRTEGELALRRNALSFEDLTMQVSSGGRAEGLIVLNGEYGLGKDGGVRLEGSWTDGVLDSPFLGELIELIGSEPAVDRLAGYKPAGTFDASFRYQSALGDRPRDYLVKVNPRTVAMRVNETPIYIQLDPGAEVTFTPGRIVLAGLSGRHAGGRLDIAGTIELKEQIEVDLRLGYTGSLRSEQLAAFYPQRIREALERINFQDGEPARLRGSLHLVEAEGPQGARGWRGDFRAMLEARGVSFSPGFDFTEIDGIFDVVAHLEPGTTPTVEMNIQAEQLRAQGYRLTNVSARAMLTDDGQSLVVEELRGDAYGGVVTARAKFGVSPNRAYEATIEAVGVALEDFVVDAGLVGEKGLGGKAGALPRGQVFGSLSLCGRLDEPDSRTGRGLVRVVGGDLGSVPLLLQMMHMLQLTLPMSPSLKFADADFYVKGDHLFFERILFESTFGDNALIQLIGEGSLEFGTLKLDTRFRSRGGILLIRDLVGGIGDKLYVIEVTGTLTDPQPRIVPLPATSSAVRFN